MVKIKLNDVEADLEPNESIDLSFKSPIAGNARGSRVFSLPFRVANSPRMASFLQNIHRLDSTYEKESLPVKVYIFDQLITEGNYFIEDATDTFFDGHFTSSVRRDYEVLQEKKIHSLLPTIGIPQIETGLWAFNVRFFSTMQGNSYALRTNLGGFSYTAKAGDTPINVSAEIVRQMIAAGINAIDSGGRITIPLSNTAKIQIIPSENTNLDLHDYLPYGEAVKRNFKKFALDNFRTPREDIAFPSILNSKLYDFKNDSWDKVINPFFSVDEIYYLEENPFLDLTSTTNASKGHWSATYTPFLRVRYILNRIIQSVGIAKMEADFEEFDLIMNDLCIYNTKALDLVLEDWQFISNADKGVKVANVHATQIDLRNHIKDMTAAEFLDTFCDTFNLTWEATSGKLLFKLKDLPLRVAPLTRRLRLVAGSLKRAFKQKEGYTFGFTKDERDDAGQYGDVVQGSARHEHKLPVGILGENIFFGKRMCQAEQKEGDDSVMRFFFDRGRQDNTTGLVKYWQSSTDALNGKGELAYVLSLEPTLHLERFFLKTVELKANSFSVNFKAVTSIANFFDMINWKNIQYEIESADGNRAVVIEEVAATVNNEGLELKIKGLIKM